MDYFIMLFLCVIRIVDHCVHGRENICLNTKQPIYNDFIVINSYFDTKYYDVTKNIVYTINE